MSAQATEAPPKGPATNGSDGRTEGVLEKWGLAYTLEVEYPLAKVKIEQPAQVREVGHQAPPSNVKEYAEQMGNGATFPPLVLTNAGILIDGNTRYAAAVRRGYETFPAYTVTVPRGSMMPLIGASLNQTGGARLSATEVMTAALAFMETGTYDDETIARFVGRSVTQIRAYRREQAFQALAKKAGLSDWDIKGISTAVRQKLSEITHLEPFKAAVKAAHDVKMTKNHAEGVVKAAEDTTSDAEAVEAIQTFVDQELVPTLGKNGQKTPKDLPSQTVKFDRAVQAIIKKYPAPLSVYEPDAEKQAVHRDAAQFYLEYFQQYRGLYGD